MKRYIWIFAILAGLYALQMIGQAVVLFQRLSIFPPVSAWYFGLIPYRVLLPIQFAILSAMVYVTWRFVRAEAWRACSRCAHALTAIAWIYGVVTLLRYATAVTLHPELRGLVGVIPIVPHVVLVAFIYTLARYHGNGEPN